MSQKRPTTKIRLTIMQLETLLGDDESSATGFVEQSVTENGRTQTVRREIGELAKPRRVKSKDQPR